MYCAWMDGWTDGWMDGAFCFTFLDKQPQSSISQSPRPTKLHFASPDEKG